MYPNINTWCTILEQTGPSPKLRLIPNRDHRERQARATSRHEADTFDSNPDDDDDDDSDEDGSDDDDYDNGPEPCQTPNKSTDNDD